MVLKKASFKDWDFKLLISGSGMTRTGKSTLASQIALVLDPKVDIDRVIFRGDKLIEKALECPKNSAVIYDEAKEGLDSKKAMTSYSMNITDYFSECGWLNQFLIVVLPEFFDLNKSVALNQSIFLINCKIQGNFIRGFFDFYNRKDKRYLYIKGKKYNNYNCQKATWNGRFSSFFPFDLDEYERRKKENQRAGNKTEDENAKEDNPKFIKYRNNLIVKGLKEGFAKAAVGRMVGLTSTMILKIEKQSRDSEESSRLFNRNPINHI